MTKIPIEYAEWTTLKTHAQDMQKQTLAGHFANNPARQQELTKTVDMLRFDYSKNHITSETLALFKRYSEAIGLNGLRDKLLGGEVVNQSENRPALHTALRASNPVVSSGGEPVAERVRSERAKLFDVAGKLRAGKIVAADGAPFKHIIFLGIGGSSLGPALLMKALGYSNASAFDVHIVSNIDGHALMPVFDACEAARTLLIVASKTFTTTETLTNADTVRRWMKDAGVSDLNAHLMGVTAAPEKAKEYGVPADNVLPFAEWVGGRYSLWSAISAPVVFAYGAQVFEEFLAGADNVDQHFAEALFEDNIPILSACLDVWYTNFWNAQTRGLFVYDDRLGLLPDYLQQLETESNGKDRTQDGQDVTWQTSPILWGGVGTDCQHSVFQLMHQGTHLVPVEFIGTKNADHGEGLHHRKLLANMFAQSAALMRGRSVEEAKEKLLTKGMSDDTLDHLAASKSFRGNRPSTTILLERLTPRALGNLIAFYEHKTFVAGMLVGINPYDQMGVELGKELATELEGVIGGDTLLPEGYDASTKALIEYLQN
jgi:glucose-6-phosphate isomerase